MPSARTSTTLTVGLALGWFTLVVLAPLGGLIELASPISLSPAELSALQHSASRGLGLAVLTAGLATVLGTLLARTLGPVVLLGLVLIGRFVIAHGILALGLAPGPGAAIAALTVNLTPFAAMIVALRMYTRPRALLDAAADLGAGPWARAWHVDWPHLRPAVLAAFVWSLLQALGDVIAFELAGGGKAYTLGLLIRDALIREDAPDRALVAVGVLLVIALPCAAVIANELGHAEHRLARPSPAPWAVRVLGYLVLLALLAGPLVLFAGTHPVGVSVIDRQLAELLGRTLALATAVATVAAVAGFGLSIATRKLTGPWALAVTTLILAPLAIPPSVHGLLTLAAATRVGWPPGVGLTLAALLGPAVALGFVAARVLVSTIPATLLDAAADLGAGPFDRLRLVWLPLGRPAFVVSGAVVFAWVLGQAAIPAFTSGPGGDTLAVALTIYARAGSIEWVRRWASILVIAALVCVIVAERLTRGRRR